MDKDQKEINKALFDMFLLGFIVALLICGVIIGRIIMDMIKDQESESNKPQPKELLQDEFIQPDKHTKSESIEFYRDKEFNIN